MKICYAITLLSTVLWSVSAVNSFLKIKNSSEFDKTIKENDIVLVKFSGPNCAECKKVESRIERVAGLPKYDKILVAEVDCRTNKSVCDKYNIHTYPTLQVFKKGKPSKLIRQGTRFKRRDVVSNSVEIHNQKELEELKNNEPLAVVAYLDSNEKDDLYAWNQLSEKLSNDVAFGIVTDKILMESQKLESIPSVVLYKKFDDHTPDVYEGAIKVEKVEDFIKVNSLPLLGSIDLDTFTSYVAANRPLVYIFSDSKKQQFEMEKLFLPIAKKYKGYFTFAHINPTEYTEQADYLNLKGKKWPAVAVQDFKKGARIPFDQSKDINKQAISEFLDGLKETSVSQDEEQAANVINPEIAVTDVTIDNFEKVVMDPKKDVLLEVYAPWCGHCRNLAPTYQQLGEFMQVNNADAHGIVIARMDGTKYNVPENAGFQVQAYPAIKFIKARTNKVIDYTGQRTLHDFVDFLSTESTKQTFKIDSTNLPEKGEQIAMKHPQIQIENNKKVEA